MSRDGGMKPVSVHLQLVLDAKAQRERFAEELDGRPIQEYLREKYPLTADLVPSITSDEFAPCSGAASYVEQRLRECARCPATGGACAESPVDHLLSRGKVPVWKTDYFGSADCPQKWPEYVLRKRLTSAGIGPRLLGCRIDTFIPATPGQALAQTQAERYVEAFPSLVRWGEEHPVVPVAPPSLLISGKDFGVGKTHLAVAILAALYRAEKIRHARFEFVPDFLGRIRRAMDDYDRFGDTIAQAIKADVLVLDDLGAHNTSDWVREQLLVIANARWEQNHPTIMTTNAEADACRKTLGERAYSRFAADRKAIALDGKDQRQ